MAKAYFSSLMIVLTAAMLPSRELDLDHEGAELAQRLVEPHLAFVDPQVARVAQRVDDLFRPTDRRACRLRPPLVDR